MPNEHYLQLTYDRDMGGGNHIVNVFHVSPSTGGWVGIDTTAVANYWVGRLKAFYDSCVTAGLQGGGSIGNSCIEYEYGETPKYVPCTAQSVATGTGGQLQALQLAACVSWRTGLAGRSFRGRSFLGPLSQTAVSMPALAGAFVGAVNGAATTLIAGANAGFRLAVVSKTGFRKATGGGLVPYDGTTTHITSGSTTTAIRTMRSRA